LKGVEPHFIRARLVRHRHYDCGEQIQRILLKAEPNGYLYSVTSTLSLTDLTHNRYIQSK